MVRRAGQSRTFHGEVQRVIDEFGRRGLPDRTLDVLFQRTVDKIYRSYGPDELIEFIVEMLGPDEAIRIIREISREDES